MAGILGARLKKEREAREFTQEEVASAVKITAAALSNYERGLRDPDTGTVKRLAEFFQVTTDYLLGLSPDPKGHRSQVTTIAANRADDPLADLPEEARKSVEDFIEYAKRKYGKKED